MDTITFEWDETKNQTNQRKHGISFEEASTVFYDDYAVLFDDPDHSEEEERFLIIGVTSKEKVCIVSHCYRGSDQKIRIISARKATKPEQKIYLENLWGDDMREEYDIQNLNPRKNPYAKQLKKQITINLDANTIEYFKGMAAKSGIPYQTLINLYLTDCAANNRQLQLSWN